MQKVMEEKMDVLILPMRNGNYRSWQRDGIRSIFGSYPTYEEWKHRNKIELRCIKKRSYPTYEEWKPFSLIVSKSSICSWFLSYL